MNIDDKTDEISAHGVHNREVYRVAATSLDRMLMAVWIDCLRHLY